MKRLTFKYLSIICLTVMAVSCTYEFKADIPSDTDIVIIDGQILAGSSSSISIALASRLDGKENTESGGITASGYIESEDGSRIQGVPDNPYSSWDDFSSSHSSSLYTPSNTAKLNFDTSEISQDKKYRLHIDAGDRGSFDSDWITVYPAPVIDSVSCFKYDGSIAYGQYSGRYVDFRVTAHSDYSPYFSITYDEAWEYTALQNCYLTYNHDTDQIVEEHWFENPYYRCWKKGSTRTMAVSAASHSENKIVNAYLLSIDHTDDRVSVLYRLTVNVGSASKEYQEYWTNLEEISYVDGDLFTPIPSNMEGNIHRTTGTGPVLGYVGASKVATKVYWFRERSFYRMSDVRNNLLKQFTYFNPNYDDPNYPGDEAIYYCPPATDWYFAYSMGNIPLRKAINAKGEIIYGTYVWARRECTDCQYFGGTIDFPSDWPDRDDPNLTK